jgi:hypothetical protein
MNQQTLIHGYKVIQNINDSLEIRKIEDAGLSISKVHRCEAERCTVCPCNVGLLEICIKNQGISHLRYCKDHRILRPAER